MCKTVLNLLEAVYLRLRKIVAERVTVVEFRVDKQTDKHRLKETNKVQLLTNINITRTNENENWKKKTLFPPSARLVIHGNTRLTVKL